ncbi:hypothetical protein [Nocardioides alcanivorans]|uniref:hypothetical protein n=1 Tax=Nocardioides alcanivorans TaxID=2897352 RepID=UPI001F3EDCFE|nr:hypothetical protein [Nocardioides alcanivorans]
MPIQIAASPRPSAVKNRATGPGPLRTARGAGRELREVAFLAGAFFDAALEVGFLEVLRDRVLALEPELLLRDVLELRDPGGEDVRVAMLSTLG